MIDVSDTIVAKSDQLNADDLISGPITVKITAVNKPGGDQPITIKYEGDNGRPFKPCKTVRRILVKAWGKDASQWAGRLMTLYNEPTVKWAGKAVGGIRVSHLSHIDSDLEISLTETRGSKKPHHIKRLQTNVQTQGAPQAASSSQNVSHETKPSDQPNLLRLIKADGTIVECDSVEQWLNFINTNLPKIDNLPRLNAFDETHKQIFADLEAAGWADQVKQARDIIEQNRKRLGGGDDAGF